MKSAYCQTIIGFAAIVVRSGIASAHFTQELGQTPLGSSEWPSPTALQEPKEDGDKLDFWAHEPDQDELLFLLHRQLVEIESVTGHEGEIAQYLVNLFESHDWKVETQEVTQDRFNVLAYPKTVDHGKSTILVTSHIDTVPPFIPYSTGDGNTTIWGRGSVDAKGSVAAQIAASMKLLHPSSGADIPDDSLSLLFVVGEETSGDGMKHFSAHAPHNYSAVIFGEPTEDKLVCGHKGIIVFNIEVTGKAAHSGYPWLGISANNLLHEAVGAMLHLEPNLPRSDKYGHSTLNVGRVEGGVAANVVAEKATAMLAIRLAGGTPEEVQELIRDGLEGTRRKAEDNGGSLGIEWVVLGYPPQDMLCDVEGFDKMTVNYGTDVPNLNGTHDRYLYGPGSIFVAHGANEHLKKSDLTGAAKKFEKLILHALKKET